MRVSERVRPTADLAPLTRQVAGHGQRQVMGIGLEHCWFYFRCMFLWLVLVFGFPKMCANNSTPSIVGTVAHKATW